ncbi:MAG: glycine cleavage system protein H [Thermaerobacter sp.]|nr:glycine cleavage system protein H [Thermaerobacter sp.]
MATQPASRWQVRDDFSYHPRHHWCREQADGVLMGVTDYTQERAGDILYVSLPVPGETVRAGEPMGSIESGKWVGQLYAPVSGVVVAVNERVAADPRLLNRDPYEAGWIAVIRPDAAGSLDALWDADRYRAALEEMAEDL